MTDTKTELEREPATVKAVFLERQGYRRRRLMDVARLLPLFGVLLLLVPLLWPGSDAADVAAGRAAPIAMSKAITYVFAVWATLIAASGLFGIAVRYWGGDDHPQARRPD